MDFGGYRDITLSLLGGYQPRNAANVLSAIDILRDMGYNVSCESIRRGLNSVKWPARFEVLSTSPVVIFDGSHNPEGIRATVDTVKKLFHGKVNVLTGVMADKNYTVMAEAISEICDMVYCTKPDNPRALDAEKYAECCNGFGCNAVGINNVEKAVNTAYSDSTERNVPLLVMGSLYLYSEFREAFDKM
jgi:dihydrofolate synthase/folylpolyglutamate synthase